MAKIIETEVPDWAKWMAKDRNGDWFVYSVCPKMKEGCWDILVTGKLLRVGQGDPCEGDEWKEELYRLEDR